MTPEFRFQGFEDRLTRIEDSARRREDQQEARHAENRKRLEKIETTLAEAAFYFRLGRWTMNILAAIFGGMAVALITRWTGAKP